MLHNTMLARKGEKVTPAQVFKMTLICKHNPYI